MADLRRRTALDQQIVKIRISASEVDALREKGYLEAAAPIQEAIEAYSDLSRMMTRDESQRHAHRLRRPGSSSRAGGRGA